jgi:hypothetical protein
MMASIDPPRSALLAVPLSCAQTSAARRTAPSNAHRFRVANADSFVNANLSGGVITRLLSSTLAVFVDWPAGSAGTAELELQSVGGKRLECLLCNQAPGAQTSWVTIEPHAGGIVVRLSAAGLCLRATWNPGRSMPAGEQLAFAVREVLDLRSGTFFDLSRGRGSGGARGGLTVSSIHRWMP